MALTAVRPARGDLLASLADSRRHDSQRFTRVAVVAMAVASVPFVWVLTGLWTGRFDPARHVVANAFYDLQATAMLHGHLWVPTGSLGLEGWVHGGHTYTYFGLFPSLLRLPILAVAPGLHGELTAPSMMAAWLVAAFFTPLLAWRVRTVLRGPAALGNLEAGAFGILMAGITGGSVLVLLGSTPWVYNEDLLWSASLAIVTLFALIGVLERPARGRIVFAGVTMLAGCLDHVPVAMACAVGGLLVSVHLALGRRGAGNRRWALPMLVATLVPLAVACTVNLLKFGIPIGVDFYDQVWTHENVHRRLFLAASGGKGYGLQFLPTTLATYFDPVGIRLQSTFPFVTLPSAPPHVVGNAVFDRLYRTASIPATMPALFVLSGIGFVSTFRRRASTRLRLLRIPLVAAILAPGVVLLWGYIAPRFEADFMPVLILGAIVGLVQLWSWAEHRARLYRRSVFAVLLLAVLYGFVASIGTSVTPTEQFQQAQAVNYVTTVKAISDLTGHPLSAQVWRSGTLPAWGPADQLFIAGDCTALYVSDGEDYSTIPAQAREHLGWVPVELGSQMYDRFTAVFSSSQTTPIPYPVLQVGKDTLALFENRGRFGFLLDTPSGASWGTLAAVEVGRPHQVTTIADTIRGLLTVQVDGQVLLTGPLGAVDTEGARPLLVSAPAGGRGAPAPFRLTPARAPTTDMSLCRSLLADR